ncbi:MAG: hypothetical protein NT009_06405 [Proteobacteria bacterium]|nr:hypothetical protein [Pseudomonadota bacterium]
MKRIGLALVLAMFLFPAGRARAVEVVIPETGKITKVTAVVKKVELEKRYLTLLAEKEKKTYRIRGAKSILETLKPGDRVLVSIADEAIKYIRKLEAPEQGKKKGSPPPKASPAPENPPAQANPAAPANPPVEKP